VKRQLILLKAKEVIKKNEEPSEEVLQFSLKFLNQRDIKEECVFLVPVLTSKIKSFPL